MTTDRAMSRAVKNPILNFIDYKLNVSKNKKHIAEKQSFLIKIAF